MSRAFIEKKFYNMSRKGMACPPEKRSETEDTYIRGMKTVSYGMNQNKQNAVHQKYALTCRNPNPLHNGMLGF